VAIRKILVAYDGSEPASRALEIASDIAKRYGAKLYVLHVVPLPEDYLSTYLYYPEMEDQLISKLIEAGRNLLEKAREAASSLSVDVETVLERGDPGKKIVEKAEQLDVDLIVVGSTGKGQIKKLILGSVSEKVIKLSSRPVLVVK